ncbi:hypothetical protein Cflav_PD3098 [Pedosphaera parvula Ellin514]|uniref:Uncharacterized protein n=1 Tax=Pedosphaera parvula (strain Ellin514) TaxID=320771 RepID=B9XJH8_PEDPL|nr:hypothetical protein Cflav_PD3098 [Pedosphaera parvula Ellin514]
MKKCTYCGREYTNEATVCALDQQSLVSVGPQALSQPAHDVPASTAATFDEATRAVANRYMLVGGLWCIGGILVTAISYSSAAGGGSYVVAWGAIIFGGIRFFRGLIARSS